MTAAPPRPASARRPLLIDGVWKLAAAIATPVLPEDYLDFVAPLRAGADLRGRIVAKRLETADSATLTIKPGRSWRGHVPGQYIRIGIDIDGVRHWRAYSLTSVVGDGTISITTKAIPDGIVSNHLVREAQPGTLVMLDQAIGEFVLPTPLPAKILFLTAGSGITPVMGMLRNLPTGVGPDITLLHSAPTPADVMFAGELGALAAGGRIRLVTRHTDTAGMLDLATLDDEVPDWRERQVWVCGPTGLLDAAEAHWAGHGLADALHVERFRPTIIEPGEGGEITFLGSEVTIDADGATPILDAGEDAGLLLKSGCRMGICFGCVVTMRQGAVRDLRTGEITVAEPGDELPIQTCINAVAGSCDLEA
ncbi:MAG: ferredoxin reductase [Tetrasphaera jenkinsii]|jgi:ferredoxin-NADP reductase|nr:ferredoxin reductase [Tetrasphaera jenkinsii]